MSRWTVDPLQLVKNIGDAFRRGQTLRDRCSYLGWFYEDKAFVPANPSRRRRLNLRLPPPIGDLRLCLRDNNGADRLVFGEVLIKRDYEVDVPAPATILDLGGNIGLATIYFSRRWPSAKLAVVEPMPSNLEILRENLALNGVNATVFPAAVGVCDGTVTMALAELDCAHHIADPTEVEPGGLQVEALSVPTLLDRLGWDRIGFLKMDIEGYEAALMRERPDWLHRVDTLCMEAFDNTIDEKQLAQIASAYGFSFQVLPSGLYLWRRLK